MHSIFEGTAITSGLAFGKAFVVGRRAVRPSGGIIGEDRVAAEQGRLSQSIEKTRHQMANSLKKSDRPLSSEVRRIMAAYLSIVDDPVFASNLTEEIAACKLNAESLMASKLGGLHDELDRVSEQRRHLLLTFEDIYYRLYFNLSDDSLEAFKRGFDDLLEPVILIAFRLTPLALSILPREKLLGIVIEDTVATSHASIVAQSLRLPVIIDIPGISYAVHQDETVIMDCCTGKVIADPTKDEVEKYQALHRARPLRKRLPETPKTLDGATIRIEANVGNCCEARDAREMGVTAIGLLRSELFYLSCRQMPTARQETAFYETIFDEGISRIDVRLLDIGADKKIPYLSTEEEDNPELGMRGVRLLLADPDLLRKQVNAILHAKVHGKIRILLPFVTEKQEIVAIRKIISEMEKPQEGMPPVQIGMMAEIPATLLSLADFIPAVDFINVGTNDLIQYFFAADRHSGVLKQFLKYENPFFLHFLRDAIEVAETNGKEIKFCGRMASELKGAALLLGAGARVLSLQTDAIEEVGSFIAAHRITDFQAYWRAMAQAGGDERGAREWEKVTKSE
jgi:phosphoenolpyruvate-protein phosphotransferase